MDTITTQEIRAIKKIHRITCDNCGQLVAEAEEYDGWYSNPAEYEIKFNLKQYGWMIFKKELCEKCKKKEAEKIYNTLIELGFKENNK